MIKPTFIILIEPYWNLKKPNGKNTKISAHFNQPSGTTSTQSLKQKNQNNAHIPPNFWVGWQAAYKSKFSGFRKEWECEGEPLGFAHTLK